MRKPEIRTIARPATRSNYEAVTDLAWSLFEMGLYADVNMVNGDLVILTHAATDEQLRMAGFHPSAIAQAKITEVAELLRAAGNGAEQAARNETLVSEALYMARQGRATDAFRHLSLARVPAGSIQACCGLRSAQYGCASHGYPRVA